MHSTMQLDNTGEATFSRLNGFFVVRTGAGMGGGQGCSGGWRGEGCVSKEKHEKGAIVYKCGGHHAKQEGRRFAVCLAELVPAEMQGVSEGSARK